jgi:hypothetical protein
MDQKTKAEAERISFNLVDLMESETDPNRLHVLGEAVDFLEKLKEIDVK